MAGKIVRREGNKLFRQEEIWVEWWALLMVDANHSQMLRDTPPTTLSSNAILYKVVVEFEIPEDMSMVSVEDVSDTYKDSAS